MKKRLLFLLAGILLFAAASDGTPYVFIQNYTDRPLWPVLIPFSELKKSKKAYGLKLQ